MKSSILLISLVAAVYAQSPIDDGSPEQPEVVASQAGSSVDQVAAGSLPPGPVAMLKAYNKYHKPAPNVVVQAAAAATQSGHVQASNLPFDEAYLAPVKVHGKTFKLDFDTGSSDLWVFSTGMPKSERGSHTLYGEAGTLLSGETWSIEYGDGSAASGDVYADTVTIGAVTATVQAVEAATSVSSSFTSGVEDGLLGLGFEGGNECSPDQCYTFMHQVGPTLPENLFTATLRKGAPGTYDFGYIDHSKYTGTISYSPIGTSLSDGILVYWQFTANGYSIGSGAKVVHSMIAIADTGTSLAFVDNAIVTAYYAQVEGAENSNSAGGYIFPCSSKLPSFSIYSGGGKHTVPGSYVNYQPLSTPAGYCFGGVQSDASIGFSILGDVFLKSQFVVFDLNQTRVGFAKQA